MAYSIAGPWLSSRARARARPTAAVLLSQSRGFSSNPSHPPLLHPALPSGHPPTPSTRRYAAPPSPAAAGAPPPAADSTARTHGGVRAGGNAESCPKHSPPLVPSDAIWACAPSRERARRLPTAAPSAQRRPSRRARLLLATPPPPRPPPCTGAGRGGGRGRRTGATARAI